MYESSSIVTQFVLSDGDSDSDEFDHSDASLLFQHQGSIS